MDNPRPLDVLDQKCDFCYLLLARVKVGCSSCGKTFHPKPGCLGINEQAIQVLVDDNEGATNYRCFECRVELIASGGTQQGEFLETFRQMIMIIQTMKRDFEQKRLNSFSEGIKQAVVGNGVGTGTNNAPEDRGVGNGIDIGANNAPEFRGEGYRNQTHAVPDQMWRTEVQNHLKELREREKRSDSIILINNRFHYIASENNVLLAKPIA